jgi:hypothetical protein
MSIDFHKFLKIYFDYWLISIPISYFFLNLIYQLILELFDLIFNRDKLDNLLTQAERLDITKLEKTYQVHSLKRSTFEKSNLNELDSLKNHSAKSLYNIFRFKK